MPAGSSPASPQGRHDNNGRPESKSDGQERKAWAQMGAYAHLAVMLPLATVIGWAIGAELDRWLHTTWLYIVGLILGVVAGFVDLVRTATRNL